jgi:hypothetical protein
MATHVDVQDRVFCLLRKLDEILRCVGHGLVGRHQEVRLLVLAVLSGEHVILAGPPGVGKGMMCSRITSWIQRDNDPDDGGANKRVSATHTDGVTVAEPLFELQLSMSTDVGEIFGPVSLEDYRNGQQRRNAFNYLPTALVAFLDEAFNCNSQVLNSLLLALNEREFKNGTTKEGIHLVSGIVASNLFPDLSRRGSPELQAFCDRFLLRTWVEDIGCPSSHVAECVDFHTMLTGDVTWDNTTLRETPITRRTVMELGNLAKKRVDFLEQDDPVFKLIVYLQRALDSLSISVSSRRWRKVMRLLNVVAFTRWPSAFADNPQRHTTRILLVDLLVLQHVLPQQMLPGRELEQIRQVRELIVDALMTGPLYFEFRKELIEFGEDKLLDEHVWIDRHTLPSEIPGLLVLPRPLPRPYSDRMFPAESHVGYKMPQHEVVPSACDLVRQELRAFAVVTAESTSPNGGGTEQEYPKNLLDATMSDGCKWFTNGVDESIGRQWVMIKAAEETRQPWTFRGIGLTSANDCPQRDPIKADVYVWKGAQQRWLHVATLTQPSFTSRHQTVLYDLGTSYETKAVMLDLYGGGGNEMQLGEVQFLK